MPSIKDKLKDRVSVVPLVVEGIDDEIYCKKLTLLQKIEMSPGTGSTSLDSVKSAINFLVACVIDKNGKPFLTFDEWCEYTGDDLDGFTRLSLAVQRANGMIGPEETAELGKDSAPTS